MTGWPHLVDSLSANSRAPMSTPLPGPSVTMKWTGRVGQFSAAGAADEANADAQIANARLKSAPQGRNRLVIVPPRSGRPFRAMAVAAHFPKPHRSLAHPRRTGPAGG